MLRLSSVNKKLLLLLSLSFSIGYVGSYIYYRNNPNNIVYLAPVNLTLETAGDRLPMTAFDGRKFSEKCLLIIYLPLLWTDKIITNREFVEVHGGKRWSRDPNRVVN